MADILLVNPPAFDFKAYDHWLKPVGLLQLGGIFSRRGHRVRLFDFLDRLHPSLGETGFLKTKPGGGGKFPSREIEKPSVFAGIPRRFKHYGLSFEVFIEESRKFPAPDLVLVTSLFTYWHLGAVETIKIIRRLYPHAKIVLGGMYPSLCYEHAASHSGADLVMRRGEVGEIVAGIDKILGENGNALKETLPLPDFTFYPRLSYACLLFSVGCPFRCRYCASSLLQPELKYANPEALSEQIERLYREKGERDFALFDDALLYRANEYLLPFLETVRGLGLPLAFHTPNALHPAYLTREVTESLYAAGFKTIRLGFEIADRKMQKQMGGKVDCSVLAEASENLKKAGFRGSEIGVYIMTCYPGSRPAQIKESLELVHRLGLKSHLTQFSPIPGTPDGDALLRERELEGEPLYTNNTYWWYKSPDFPLKELETLRNLAQAFNEDL